MRTAPRRRLPALLVALVALAAAGPASAAEVAHTSVVNGVEAAPGSFPYLAFVVFEDGEGTGACTGTVVASNVVLTAAHCVLDDRLTAVRGPAEFAVVTGDVDWSSSGRTVSSVTEVAVSPEFAYLKPSYTPIRGDAAVLRLAQPVSAPSVRLASARVWEPGTPVVMAGWGLTDVERPAPTALHYGEAVVKADPYCAAEFGYFQPAAQLCALDEPEYEFATCSGDSGGPLLMTAPGTADEPLEIGITSIGGLGCPTDEPSYFTRADAVSGWVQARIAEYASPATTLEAVPQATPAPRLATLTTRRARALARRAVSEQLPGQFRRHRAFHVACARLSRTRLRCPVRWRSGALRYSGAVTVFYAFSGGVQVWRGRFAIRRVSRRCLRRAAHPSRCPVRTFRR